MSKGTTGPEERQNAGGGALPNTFTYMPARCRVLACLLEGRTLRGVVQVLVICEKDGIALRQGARDSGRYEHLLLSVPISVACHGGQGGRQGVAAGNIIYVGNGR